MLSPVPGLTYLKILTPASPPPPRRKILSDDARAEAAPLITVALQAAFGMRPVERLPRRTFSDAVRARIKARLRSSPARGPVALRSLRAVGGEVFGTCEAQGRVFGFTAVVAGGRVESFRVF